MSHTGKMHPRRRPAPSTDSAERITILLVDDDPDCRELIREAAEHCEVTKDIHEVATGEEAIDFLLRRGKFVDAPRPGLVYLDVEMPGIGGLETLKRIRAEDQLADIPVVMMTGVSCETHMKLAAELGANSYTLKPANPEQFLRTVQAATDYWLQIHQSPGHKWPQEACRR